MKIDTLTLIRDAGNVRRFHTVRAVVNTETIAHHTAGVLSLLFFLYEDPPMSLIKYALAHDAAEIATGDVPATAKWNFAGLASALHEAEEAIEDTYDLPTCPKIYQDVFKFADMMDLCFKCLEEISVGNINFVPILERGINFCAELYKDSPSVKKIPQAGQLITLIASSPMFPFEEIANARKTKH